MRIRDYVTGRVLAWIIIAVLGALFSIGQVRAAAPVNPCLTLGHGCTQTQAYALAIDVARADAICNNSIVNTTHSDPMTVTNPNPSAYGSRYGCKNAAGTVVSQPTQREVFYHVGCPAGTTWNDILKRCHAPCNYPASTGTCNANKGGQCTSACFAVEGGGCKEIFSHTDPGGDILVTDGDNPGLFWHGTWTPNGETCTPGEYEQPKDDGPEACPIGQKQLPDGSCVKQGNCPVGMNEDPATHACRPDGACPTGQQKAPDGSCMPEQCPQGFAKKKDGTCGLDDNGDGAPDDEEDGNDAGDKASGGDSCDVPPTCGGNAIMCLQTKIQWRIDCNTRKQRTVTGGACGAPPICSGEKCDALEYSSLMMQWRSACALEKLGEGTPGGGNDDGTISGGACETNYTCSGGNPMLCASLQEQNRMRCAAEQRRSELATEAGSGDGDDGDGDMYIGGDPAELNQGLVSYGGGIPDISFEVEGVRFDPFGGAFATVIAMIKWLVIASASVAAYFIMRGSW